MIYKVSLYVYTWIIIFYIEFLKNKKHEVFVSFIYTSCFSPILNTRTCLNLSSKRKKKLKYEITQLMKVISSIIELVYIYIIVSLNLSSKK